MLDIDAKRPEANGFDTLDALGFAVLPNTPMAHTASGGMHLYFARAAELGIGCTQGEKGRGIGRGLDWRGTGGYVIVPSPGSGYEWDAHWHPDAAPFAPVPKGLLPRESKAVAAAHPVKPTIGLSPYGEAALDSACRRIIEAPAGQQERTLNGEVFAIGTLAGAGAIPASFARQTLLWAARKIPDHDPHRPWHAQEIEIKVNRAFDEGMRRPREARCA